MNNDLAGKKYWNESWLANEIPQPIDPHSRGLNNYPNRCFHEYFAKIFSGLSTQGLKLLEIGCGRSAWLPYFAREFGFQVYGIDYSEIGCQQARQVLAKAGVEGEVICADFFAPPVRMLTEFDIVISFGVAEHFVDTNNCLLQFSKFLKSEGKLITIIPNLTGWFGFLQKTFNKSVYEIHVILSVEEFHAAHLKAKFKVIDCRYFMSQSIALVNLQGLNPKKIGTRLKIIFQIALVVLANMIWLFEKYLITLPTTAVLSPYIICVAKKEISDAELKNEQSL